MPGSPGRGCRSGRWPAVEKPQHCPQHLEKMWPVNWRGKLAKPCSMEGLQLEKLMANVGCPSGIIIFFFLLSPLLLSLFLLLFLFFLPSLFPYFFSFVFSSFFHSFFLFIVVQSFKSLKHIFSSKSTVCQLLRRDQLSHREKERGRPQAGVRRLLVRRRQRYRLIHPSPYLQTLRLTKQLVSSIVNNITVDKSSS